MSNAILPTYNRSEIALERGEGAYVWDVNGKKYLDFASGIAVSGLGHSHPHLIEALTAQAGKIWHTSNLYRVPQQERLAERLTAASFADKVFFTNSGAEAVECAMKTARRYHYVTGHPERYRIITMSAAFHGRTLATIAATDQEKLQSGFGPMPEGFDVVEFGNLAAVEAKIAPETAAIMVEPVQGEGGIRPVPKDQLQALRALADKHGLLLILDEIQCGMGRTGKLFAHEHAGVVPDIVATAKGIGGGFPLGACLMTDKAAQGMVAGTHGSTYGGNPLACAVGNAVLDIILAPGFLDQVAAAAGRLEAMLGKLAAEHPGAIEAVRGLGLIRGLKLRPGFEVRDLVVAGRAHGILTVPAGNNVIRLLPPLTIGAAEIDAAYDKLSLAIKDLEQAAAAKPGAA